MLSAALVKETAACLGFTACGLAPATRVAPFHEERLRTWLSEGRHGEMDYLARNLDVRLDPRRLVEGAQTVVAVALNYFPESPLSPDGYRLARYAYGKDYHDVVRWKLRELMQALALAEPTDGRPFCDTAPIDERYWAWRCGLGWIGKSTQLIVPQAGTYFFLGELVLTHAADAYDAPMASRCGACTRCLDACPTQALSADDGLDARRCLSYLTIEHRGALPAGIGEKMNDCIYGCDRCAEACPYNRFARPTEVPEFQPNAALCAMTQDDWSRLTVEQYRLLFKGSAVKRAKYEGLVRNVQAVRE